MREVLNISTGLSCFVIRSTEIATKDAFSCRGQPNICMSYMRIYFTLMQQQHYTICINGFKWFENISCLLAVGVEAYRPYK